MHTRPVPIHHTSPAFTVREVGPFRVTEVGFEPRASIAPHFHDRPNIGIMLEGSFDLQFQRRAFVCEPGALFIEPAGDTHCNCMGCQGARVLAVEPDPSDPMVALALDALTEPRVVPAAEARRLARRMASELLREDLYAPLMIQGLGYELLGLASRQPATAETRTPRWLTRLEERLASEPVRNTGIGELASEAGVHPSHLARTFRARHGRSLGRYLLDQRLEWAAQALATTDRTIADIALEAGFADQSHFTRRFQEYAGMPPARFRRARRPPRPSRDQ